MAVSEITQGNMAKLVVTLTENSSAYSGLSGADTVTLTLANARTGASALTALGTSPNVTLDDGGTGIVSWQLTSPQTNGLQPGFYHLSVQTDTTNNILEWVEEDSVCIKSQIISN